MVTTHQRHHIACDHRYRLSRSLRCSFRIFACSSPGRLTVSLVFAYARSRTSRRRIRHRGSEQLRLGDIRCRRAVIAEHELNFGPIPVGEREICSECDAAVEVLPGALQIPELSTRETA